MGGLEKMKVIAYANDKFQGTGIGQVEVLINPEKYKHTATICYSTLQASGSAGASSKFNRVPPDVVSFELVFDATGVVGNPTLSLLPVPVKNVALQIQSFKDIVLEYDEQMHSPRYVQLSWGTLVFNCRMSAFDVVYTLFEPNGTPLRAKATVSFKKYISPETLARKTKKKSPDLTHVVRVRDGDTLPLMCYRVYGDASYYIQVAQKNKLTDFRDLRPDMDIVFPPIKK